MLHSARPSIFIFVLFNASSSSNRFSLDNSVLTFNVAILYYILSFDMFAQDISGVRNLNTCFKTHL